MIWKKKPHDTVILERRFAQGGTCIINEGEEGSSAFLIQSGSVQIFSMHNNKKVILGTLQMGEIFGEMSLIKDIPRSASVEALEDCNLIVITRQSLKAKLDSTDATIRAILMMLIRRVQQGNDSLMNKKPTFDDLQESLLVLYEDVLSGLPKTKKPHFRQDVLPLIEELNQKMAEYKSMSE
jgi:CRP/FNR family cyclic AMP-dependent transcriptional regulator